MLQRWQQQGSSCVKSSLEPLRAATLGSSGVGLQGVLVSTAYDVGPLYVPIVGNLSGMSSLQPIQNVNLV